MVVGIVVVAIVLSEVLELLDLVLVIGNVGVSNLGNYLQDEGFVVQTKDGQKLLVYLVI